MTDGRLREIINEATQQQTISRITWEERQEMAEIYKKITGEQVNPSCNACMIKISYEINKQLNKVKDGNKRKATRKTTVIG
jgi:hypothetical protein